jgi:hypothetical protein
MHMAVDAVRSGYVYLPPMVSDFVRSVAEFVMPAYCLQVERSSPCSVEDDTRHQTVGAGVALKGWG